MYAPRLLVTETLSPNSPLSQWISSAIQRLGWKTWILPTFEAVRMFGTFTYASMVVKIVNELRPHVLLVNPPYDHLHAEACRKIRKFGTRIIGLAFDVPSFQGIWGEK